MSENLKNFSKIVLIVFVLHGLGQMIFGRRLELPTDTVRFYSPAAISLLEGKGYRVEGIFSSRYPPLYPAFIAFIYKLTGHAGTDNPFYPYFVIFLQSLSCGFLYLIASQFVHEKTALLSAVLFATYPFFAALSMTRYVWNVMPVFLIFFYPSLYLLIRTRKSAYAGLGALSGLLLGFSSLAWPAVIYIWAIFALFLFWTLENKGLKKAVVICGFCIGFFLPVLIWSFKVYGHTGKFQIAHTQALAIQDGLIHDRGFKFKSFAIAQHAKEEIEQDGLKNIRDLVLFYQREFFQNPFQAIKFILFKCFRPWYATDSEKNEEKIILVQIPYLLFGGWGLWNLLKNRQDDAAFLVVIICYFWLISFAGLSILRYMIPAMGLLMILAAQQWGREIKF